MKKEELNFKILTTLADRNKKIKEALIERKFIGAEEIRPDVGVLFCDAGCLDLSYQLAAINDREHLPEVTFEQALELIEQVEIEDDKSEWGLVSFDIFENEGRYVYYENDCVGYAWQNHINCEIKTGMIFAGWQYEKGETLNTRRGNVNHGGFCRTVDFPKNLKAPAIPIKIWFWRRK